MILYKPMMSKIPGPLLDENPVICAGYLKAEPMP
jgi:hypothetical protein